MRASADGRAPAEGAGRGAAGARQRELIQSCSRDDLVDEVRALIYPIVVGPGKRLFGEGTSPALRVVDVERLAT